MTSKEQLWQQYYAAVKAGRRKEAQVILQQIHTQAPRRPYPGRDQGKCSKCRKNFRTNNHRTS